MVFDFALLNVFTRDKTALKRFVLIDELYKSAQPIQYLLNDVGKMFLALII